MNSWIDLHALWKIVLLGLLAGAGLPALFAVGLKSLSAGGGSTKLAASSPAGVAGAVACFAVVLAAIAYGIYLVVDGS